MPYLIVLLIMVCIGGLPAWNTLTLGYAASIGQESPEPMLRAGGVYGMDRPAKK